MAQIVCRCAVRRGKPRLTEQGAFVLTAAALAAAFAITAAQAHPHAWIDATVEAQFDVTGRLEAIGQTWTFDYDYSAVLRATFDRNSDGALDEAELAELTGRVADFAGRADYFTRVTQAGAVLPHHPPADLTVRVEGLRLVATMSLPLAEPVAVSLVGIDIFDPPLDFEIVFGPDPLHLAGAPEGCTITRRATGFVDAEAATLFRALGIADAETAADSAAGFGFRVLLDCRGPSQ